MLVNALVHCRLEYGNSVLVGIPAYLQRRLQSLLNAAARLIYRLGFHDHITHQFLLLASCRVREVEGGLADTQGSPQHCATLPWDTQCCIGLVPFLRLVAGRD